MLLALVLASLLDEPVADDPPPADRGVISGLVRNKETRAPAVDAPIVLRRPDGFERRTTTDADGLYAFRELAAGTYVMTASYGKSTSTKTLDLASGAKFRVSFALDPSVAIATIALVKATRHTASAAAPHRSRSCRRWYRAWNRVLVRDARQKERAARREARKR